MNQIEGDAGLLGYSSRERVRVPAVHLVRGPAPVADDGDRRQSSRTVYRPAVAEVQVFGDSQIFELGEVPVDHGAVVPAHSRHQLVGSEWTVAVEQLEERTLRVCDTTSTFTDPLECLGPSNRRRRGIWCRPCHRVSSQRVAQRASD